MRMKPLWAALLALGLTGAHAADLLVRDAACGGGRREIPVFVNGNFAL